MAGQGANMAANAANDSAGKMFYALQRLSGCQYRIAPAINLVGGNAIGNQAAINQDVINKAVQTLRNLNPALQLPAAIAIPVQIGVNQWAALVLKKNANGGIDAIYADPQGNAVPGVPPYLHTLLENAHNMHGIGIQEYNRSIRQIPADNAATGIIAALNMHDLIYSGRLKYGLNPGGEASDSRLKMEALNDYLNLDAVQLKIINYNNDNYLRANELHNETCQILTNLFLPLRNQYLLNAFSHGSQLQAYPQVTAHLRALDVIARAYSSTPYTAVIEPLDADGNGIPDIPLYISISDHTRPDHTRRRVNAPTQAMQDRNVATALREVIIHNDNVHKMKLIQAMHKNKNSSLASVINNIDPAMRAELTRILALQNITDADIQNNLHIQNFITNIFDKIFHTDDLNALRDNPILMYKLEQGHFKIIYEPNDISQGTHVENQGVAEMTKRHNVENFSVGLSNARYERKFIGGREEFFPKGFCCAACTAERNVLNGIGINIEVRNTSETNFPEGSYMPSWNVTKDPATFLNYLRTLRTFAANKLNIVLTDGVYNFPDNFYNKSLRIQDIEFYENARNAFTALHNNIVELEYRRLQLGFREGPQLGFTEGLQLGLNLRYTEKTELSEHTGSKFNMRAALKAVNHPNTIEQFSPPDNKSLQPTQNQDQPAIKGDKVSKVGKVSLISEANHITDHKDNISSLISQIRSGIITSDTVICLERKEEGKNLGMPDVILLGNIIKHNEKADDNSKIEIPESIQKSQIYHDALLYNAATARGIMVRGIEGKVKNDKNEKPDDHNTERESIMVNKIKETVNNGKNVIYVVGEAHVEALKGQLGKDGVDVMVKENNAVFHRIIQEIGPNAIGKLRKGMHISGNSTSVSTPSAPKDPTDHSPGIT